MMKRLACAMLASVLVLALACVSFAGETQTAETAGAYIQPTASADGEVSSIIFAVSTSIKDKADVQGQTALLLMKPLLARLMRTGARADIYKINNDATPAYTDAPLNTREDLNALYSKLNFSVQNVNIGVSKAFSILAKKLSDKFTAKEYIAKAKKVELWLVDRRDPLYMTSQEEESGSISNALDSLQTMMGAIPGLEVHFVYLSNESPKDSPKRIDNLLRDRASDASRVFTDIIDTSDIGKAFEGIMQTVKAKMLAAIPCDIKLIKEDKATFSYVYEHRPARETGSALLLFPPEFTFASIAMEIAHLEEADVPEETPSAAVTPEMTSAPAVTSETGDAARASESKTDLSSLAEMPTELAATMEKPMPEPTAAPAPIEPQESAQTEHIVILEKDAGWLLLQNASAGDYTVKLELATGLKEGEKVPQPQAYRIMEKPVVSLSYETGGKDMLFDNHTMFYRGTYNIFISSSPIDPSIKRRDLYLIVNGELDKSILIEPVSGEQNRWKAAVPVSKTSEISLGAVLKLDGFPAFYSKTVTAAVLNRKPVAIDGAQKEYTIYYDYPGARKDDQLKVDLNSLFKDPESDMMYFAFNGDPRDSYTAEIKNGYFLYTPQKGSPSRDDIHITLTATDEPLLPLPVVTQDQPLSPQEEDAAFTPTTADDGHAPKLTSVTAEINAAAPDPNGEHSPVTAAEPTLEPIPDASVTLTIRQVSLAECLQGWRFVFDPEMSQNISDEGGGRYLGVPGKELKLAFKLIDREKKLAPFQAYNNFDAAKVMGALSVKPGNYRVNDNSVPDVPEIKTGNQEIIISFAKTEKNTAYTLDLDVTFNNSLKLPGLINSISLAVHNTPPVLREGIVAKQEFKADINGAFGNYIPVPLAKVIDEDRIDLPMYFTDAETPDKLEYRIIIKSSAAYELTGFEPAQPEAGGQAEYLLMLENGNYHNLDLTITGPGLLEVTVTAIDGELESGSFLVFSVRVESSFIRILWLAGLGLAVLLLLAVALLVIHRIRLPRFKDISVTALSAGDNEINTVAPQTVSLDAFGKEGVSLLTLMMLFQLFPLKCLGAAVAGDILICPARRAVAAISLGTRSTKQHVFINGSAVKKGKPFLVSGGQYEITAGKQRTNEKVILNFIYEKNLQDNDF